ncbi:glycoside hydrolase family 3 N-terminal domain-containing protein [Streptomonospora wellingtoniae]|uniref:Glycoside hydrolase family 3 N-terminal domain-containing protein n=1 Tax=Streptomonospora wellingtoniae TaxID=3075544 RepID=A0ABU2L060_9ACTN|nr:glycoside hydrolase family 3 N-terminal domain-containing protein [Streptomonospora sp. DSM 45055]MDT0304723.1 glycoside hydrolase family 3 N-terminal domain-containing protein [Streptomonospora sp. DSM 45055]
MSAAGDPVLRRMAHTVLMPGFAGTAAPSWLARAVDEGVGAVLYFAHNLADDPARLSAELRSLRPDLLTASDEEGGRVSRLHAAGTSSNPCPHPGHGELGRGSPDRTRRAAAAMGRELAAAGIGAALAPVADLASDPRNTVIGDRSFGADPKPVAAHTAAFVEGLHAAGVAAAAKHFPGHGDTATDSHLGLPVVTADAATLRSRELVPFSAAVAAGTDMVMTGHLAVPALDTAPASVSARCYELLREGLGFEGVAVTDALDMRGLSAHTGAADRIQGVALGAAAALAAGADLLCLGNPAQDAGIAAGAVETGTAAHVADEALFTAARDAVLAALDRQSLPAGRLAEAAGRVERLLAQRTPPP